MKEDFLHFVWRLRRFRHNNLQTTTRQAIEIIDLGRYNTDAGPDFLDARIRINGTLWAGHVEMHLRSGQWYDHKHHEDPNYDNVILHVVLDENVIIRHQDGERIPCLNIKPYIEIGMAKQYLRLLHSEQWIACQTQLYTVPEIKRNLWLDRLAVERLEEKTQSLHQLFITTNGDWEETFYQSLLWGIGLKVNADTFLLLAQSLPLKILLKHKHSLLQIEALLFGQAGMLNRSFEDHYPKQLQNEYVFLSKKYGLQPISEKLWKFMRMRPANFPTIRIAQYATLIYRTGNLFSKMLVAKNLKEIENAFNIELSNYWQTHFRFDRISKKQAKKLGKTRIHLLAINVIAPILFLYGKIRGDERYLDRASNILADIAPEKNRTIQHWKALGVIAQHAGQSQALLQLKHNYCDSKRCLDCVIGCHVLKLKNELQENDILYLPTWWLEHKVAKGA